MTPTKSESAMERYKVRISVEVEDAYPGEFERRIMMGCMVEDDYGAVRRQRIELPESRLKIIDAVYQRLVRDNDLLFDIREQQDAGTKKTYGTLEILLPCGVSPEKLVRISRARDKK